MTLRKWIALLGLVPILGFSLDQGGGYLGNVGTTTGNCTTNALPPLSAFGSLTINQNAPLGSVNRLNPTQRPTTNNFQAFQSPEAIDTTTTWTSGSVQVGAPSSIRMRMGPYLVGMTQLGPIATIPQYLVYTDAGGAFPNITAEQVAVAPFSDIRSTIFFSATEATSSFFNVSTEVVNSETCIITYKPKNGHPGKIIDYQIMGNMFHDVYFENLTPAIAVNNPAQNDGSGVLLSIDDGPVQSYTFGLNQSGTSFQFFITRATNTQPMSTTASVLLFAEDAAGNPIEFTVMPTATSPFIFTATKPFTGFIRLAALSSQDAPTAGSQWTQNTYFMPTSCDQTPVSCSPYTCPVEAPNPPCTNAVASESWWKTCQVDAIAPTGLNFYLLWPNTTGAWTTLFGDLAIKQIGGTWSSSLAPSIKYPDAAGLSDILPVISAQNPLNASGYYSDLSASQIATDLATNYFVLRFDMLIAENQSLDISTYQTTNRQLPNYSIMAPNNIQIYKDHSRYIPVKADLSFTNQSVSWNYTLSSVVPPPTSSGKVLVCFPFWKRLQGTVLDFIYNDTVKGTMYATEGVNGTVTLLENSPFPAWYGVNSYFIPDVVFTAPQLTELGNALAFLATLPSPKLPYFPENYLDTGYNAGKTCYMLAKSALYIAYYLQQAGMGAQIVSMTQPYVDNAISALTAWLVARPPGSSFFIADQTAGGICVNGAGGDGTWALGPNLQQQIDSGEDFGNYIYNDHHFFAGYFLMAAAMITEWQQKYAPSNLWIDVPVLGAEGNTYKMRDFVDFLWRDVHNPFQNDPDMPFNRYGFTWEGHGTANGLQYSPNALGRNQESISEDYNCWVAMNAWASLVLNTSLTPDELQKYQTLKDFSEVNLKMVASAGIQWYKNTNYWKRSVSSSDLTPAIYIGQFSQATVTNGQVNDNSAQNQTFF